MFERALGRARGCKLPRPHGASAPQPAQSGPL